MSGVLADSRVNGIFSDNILHNSDLLDLWLVQAHYHRQTLTLYQYFKKFTATAISLCKIDRDVESHAQ